MKIRTKILGPFLGMSVLIALVGGFAVNQQEQTARSAATTEARNVAHALALAVISDSNQLDSSSVAVIRRLHEQDKRDMVLMDIHKRILADARPASVGQIYTDDEHDEVARTIKDGTTRSFVETSVDEPGGIKQIVAPVQAESGRMLGAVIVEYTPFYEELMKSMRRAIYQVIGSVIISLAIALSTALYMSRSLARPLEQLKTAAEAFAGGRIDCPMPPPRNDEIGRLAVAFQNMVEKRRRTEAELLRLHGELEARVHERTAELANTNEMLREENAERRRGEDRLATQSAISRVLADSNTLNEATPKIIQAICKSEGWDFGRIWELDKKSNKLRCLEAWHRPEVPAQELAASTRQLTFSLNAGLPGRVWASGQPLLIPDITEDGDYPCAPLATSIELRSALGFPILLDGEIVGVMDFLGREIHAPDEKMLAMFLGIGRQVGSFFKRLGLEDQFRQSQKMEGVGQLAGGVAHDFNNILAVIQMQSDYLKTSGGLSAEQMEVSEEISHTVQRASALTRQLLLFSRREVFQPRDLDLSQSIANTTKMLKRILGETIEMELKLTAQPMFVHADPGMMDQVLLNLAVNAHDAMPNGGRLVIETSGVEFDEFAASQSPQARPGSFVCLSVGDSGCGIPPEILSKIFEPFFTTKDVGKGTGLGLATVFGVAQQHQGWINVYSEVGHGTTFRMYLPRLAGNTNLKSSPPATTAASGGNETILLVEDESSLRGALRKSLSQLGYHILEAASGIKALDVWKENREKIHLLLTDMVMPEGLNGKDLAQRLLQENSKLKVIYMSGYSAEAVGKDFLLNENDNFLTKPFQASKLRQMIREKLDEKI